MLGSSCPAASARGVRLCLRVATCSPLVAGRPTSHVESDGARTAHERGAACPALQAPPPLTPLPSHAGASVVGSVLPTAALRAVRSPCKAPPPPPQRCTHPCTQFGRAGAAAAAAGSCRRSTRRLGWRSRSLTCTTRTWRAPARCRAARAWRRSARSPWSSRPCRACQVGSAPGPGPGAERRPGERRPPPGRALQCSAYACGGMAAGGRLSLELEPLEGKHLTGPNCEPKCPSRHPPRCTPAQHSTGCS